ncbi:hypothetical protein CPT_Stills40 [Bacillus phage Stills]|uniref:Uncharacterized protein n=1 Tax=Bacillus phage Stills TaxID=1610833 RepID=A0A0E3XAM4_9CAUD|nr:hypothetical protein CPT_Stills40 [Bacillus phage Stills]AKC02668.1 hypothetical protein CPT_Stills40 [Bacillus phage Stills]
MTSYLYDDGNGLRTSARVEPTTGKPITDVSNMVKTKSGLWIPQTGTEDGAANIQVAGSDVMLPTQMQSKLSTVIQTHVNTVVALSANNTSSYQDVSAWSDITMSFLNSATATCQVDIMWSHDGVSAFFTENALASASRVNGFYQFKTKAKYAAVKVTNGDGTAAKTMNSWLFLSL